MQFTHVRHTICIYSVGGKDKKENKKKKSLRSRNRKKSVKT
jgi:hypothetical protein